MSELALAAFAAATDSHVVREPKELKFRRFARAFDRARYGPPATAERAADELRRELHRILGNLRGRLGPGRRARGFFRLRSLRSG